MDSLQVAPNSVSPPLPHAQHLSRLIKVHSEYASGLDLIFIATLIDKFMQCHPLAIWRSTWHTVLGLLGAGMRHAACGMGHVACVQVSLQVGKVRWLLFLFVQCSFSFYWQRGACSMWQLHRLEVDAAPLRHQQASNAVTSHRSGPSPTQTRHTHTHVDMQAQGKCCVVKSFASRRGACKFASVCGSTFSAALGGAVLTPFGGFGLGRQIKPVSNALSSLPATCSTATLQHCSIAAFSALSVSKWVFAVSKQRSTAIGDVRYSYRYICIFGDSWAAWVLDTWVKYSIAIWN